MAEDSEGSPYHFGFNQERDQSLSCVQLEFVNPEKQAEYNENWTNKYDKGTPSATSNETSTTAHYQAVGHAQQPQSQTQQPQSQAQQTELSSRIRLFEPKNGDMDPVVNDRVVVFPFGNKGLLVGESKSTAAANTIHKKRNT